MQSTSIFKNTRTIFSFVFWDVVLWAFGISRSFSLIYCFPTHSFSTTMKTSENVTVFWCLRGVREGCIREKLYMFGLSGIKSSLYKVFLNPTKNLLEVHSSKRKELLFSFLFITRIKCLIPCKCNKMIRTK